MASAKFIAVHPVLPVRNVTEAIAYYTERLGFKLVFKYEGDSPGYAVISRDDVELHLQWHDSSSFESVERLNLRLFIENVEMLFDEYKDEGVFHDRTALRDTAWGTREFGFYDPDNNGLTFYRDL